MESQHGAYKSISGQKI